MTARKAAFIAAISAGLVTSFGVLVALLLGSHDTECYFSIEGGRTVVSVNDQLYICMRPARKWTRLGQGERPVFLPGLSEFLFEFRSKIYRYDLTSGKRYPLLSPNFKLSCYDPVWDWKAREVIFAVATDRRFGGSMTFSPTDLDLYRCNLDGTGVRRLTQRSYFAISIGPSSIAGRHLYFSNISQDGQQAICDLDLNKSIVRTVTIQASEGDPSVSPDGRSLAFAGPPGYFSLIAMDLKTKKLTVLRGPLDNDFQDFPLFSSDGRAVYYLGEPKRAGVWEIEELNLRNGTVRPLATLPRQ